ncbi:hypothetical protein PAECIP111890_02395 [Paenibacillus sp. JJ-223]|nr:hypothetical protein PAECIP111890_02395 [Paenibacillus sp. JJ-223]
MTLAMEKTKPSAVNHAVQNAYSWLEGKEKRGSAPKASSFFRPSLGIFSQKLKPSTIRARIEKV